MNWLVCAVAKTQRPKETHQPSKSLVEARPAFSAPLNSSVVSTKAGLSASNSTVTSMKARTRAGWGWTTAVVDEDAGPIDDVLHEQRHEATGTNVRRSRDACQEADNMSRHHGLSFECLVVDRQCREHLMLHHVVTHFDVPGKHASRSGGAKSAASMRGKRAQIGRGSVRNGPPMPSLAWRVVSSARCMPSRGGSATSRKCRPSSVSEMLRVVR